MCVSRVFVSDLNLYFLRQILVFVHQSIRAPIQMAWFLRRMLAVTQADGYFSGTVGGLLNGVML